MATIGKLDDVSLLKLFIALRDRRTQRKSAYTDDDSSDKSKQDKIEIEFLRRFQSRGVDSVSARDIGTAYMSERESFTVADKDAFIEHVKQHDAYELIESRVNKTAAQQYKEVHEDLPPGVNHSATQVVNFRRK